MIEFLPPGGCLRRVFVQGIHKRWREAMKREVERKMRMVGLLCGVAVASMAGVFDFETGDLQGWQVVEGTFGKPVTDRAKEHNADRNRK